MSKYIVADWRRRATRTFVTGTKASAEMDYCDKVGTRFVQKSTML